MNRSRKAGTLIWGELAGRFFSITHPPFYTRLIEQHILLVLGGLITNTRFQALNKGRQDIPGLYLAGNTAGNRFAIDYPTNR
jgi:fumarate reductase flavoprotein subunit